MTSDRLQLADTVRCAKPRHERFLADDDAPTGRFLRATLPPESSAWPKWIVRVVFAAAGAACVWWWLTNGGW